MNQNYRIKLSKIGKPFQDVKKEVIVIGSLTKILLDSMRESETFKKDAIENISVVLYDRIEALNKKINTFEAALNKPKQKKLCK